MAGSSQGSATEYVVRVPKYTKKKYHMMRFHAALGVDFKTWTHTKVARENNMKEFKGTEEEMPRYGAGSEYGREQREEARRKKYGINVKKYRPEDQPWVLSVAGKNGRKFKGIREGGVSENSSWYVFMQGKDGAFEAYPVEEWYNFKLIQQYKALSAEEAEREFERRDKIMNYFSVMYQKKLKKDGDEAGEGEEEKTKKKGPSAKNLMLSELDDWMSDDGSDGDEDKEGEDDDDDEGNMKKKKKVPAKGRKQHGGKKKKNPDGDSDDDCFEESDEYDDGAEHDYISSDSSDSDAENDEIVRKELAGVDQADALKKLLNSDEEDEEEKEKEEEENEEDKKESEDKEEKDKKKEKEEEEKGKEG